MYSYHRILQIFGRSVQDNTLECDIDIHPWEIKINKENWPGKIRLIGFVDVFFIISYSGNARFERGIIVYKDKVLLQELLSKLGRKEAEPADQQKLKVEEEVEPADQQELKVEEDSDDDDLFAASAEKDRLTNEEDASASIPVSKAEAEAEFTHQRTYKIKSCGHTIGLSTKYPKSSVKDYTVEMIKPRIWSLRRQVRRGIKPHGMQQLMADVVRCGVISQGQLMGHLGGMLFVGGALDTTTHKFWEGVMAGHQAGRQTLSNEM